MPRILSRTENVALALSYKPELPELREPTAYLATGTTKKTGGVLRQ